MHNNGVIVFATRLLPPFIIPLILPPLTTLVCSIVWPGSCWRWREKDEQQWNIVAGRRIKEERQQNGNPGALFVILLLFVEVLWIKFVILRDFNERAGNLKTFKKKRRLENSTLWKREKSRRFSIFIRKSVSWLFFFWWQTRSIIISARPSSSYGLWHRAGCVNRAHALKRAVNSPR